MISTIETFDSQVASQLLKYKDIFKGKIRNFDNDESYDPFKILQNYVSKSKKGKINVIYNQRDGRGRYFADFSCSLQSLAREIRGTIAGDLYYDVDMVCCHATIFKQLCDNAGLSTTYTTLWCYEREKITNELIKIIPDADKDSIKQGILSIINGGDKFYEDVESCCKKANYDWLDSFRAEVVKNVNKLCELNSELYQEMVDKKKSRPKSSAANMLFCIIENKLLNVMIEYFRSVKIIRDKNNYVNCFDGIMLEQKKCKSVEHLETHISKVEKLFEMEGFRMKLKVKPFEKINLHISRDELDVFRAKSVYKPIILNRFDYKDPFTFLDFYNTYSGRHYDSEQDMLNEILPLYPRVIVSVLAGEGLYIKKTHTDIDVTKHLGQSNFMMTYCDGDKTARTLLSDIIKRHNSFEDMACKLDNNSIANRSFNIWKGFQADRVDLDDLTDDVKENLELLKAFIMDVWASGDQVSYDYILSWFSGMVTNLNGINGIAMAIVSKEGCGKGTLTNFMKYIIGNDAIAEVIGIKPVTGKHNTIIQNKRLVLINEMASTQEEFKSNFETLKALITDESVTIDPKGLKPYKIDNIGNYILCTNNADSIIVSQSDRRYAVFEASDKYMQNVPYFTNLRKRCFNQDVANAFYTYLLDFDTVPLEIIPQTKIRSMLQLISLPSPLKFYNYIIEENIYEIGEKVPATTLYRDYTQWCGNNGERSITSTKFGNAIGEKLEKKRSNGIKYIIS